MDEYHIMGNKVIIANLIGKIEDPIKTINSIRHISSINNQNCTIQLINSNGLAGEKHLLQAILQALKAFEREKNISNDLGLEICVRASFQRQISRALEILGIKKGRIPIFAVAINCENQVMDHLIEKTSWEYIPNFERDDKTLKKIYEITEDEINAAGSLEKVMMERCALLNLEI